MCIGDDTKAAARKAQIALKRNKKLWRKTIFNMANGILTPCKVASDGIMTVN